MVDYVESPFERLISIHMPKKDDHGGGGPAGPCVPEYTYISLPAFGIYYDESTFIQPHACCPPVPYPNEADYAQHTVFGGGSPQVTLTWTWPSPYINTRMAVWIRPQQNPLNFRNPALWDSTDLGSTVQLHGPAGEPTQIGPNGGDLTVIIPFGLKASAIPGAPPADPAPNVTGTWIIFAVQAQDPFSGLWQTVTRPDIDASSTIKVQNLCPPGSSLTATEEELMSFKRPPGRRPR